jgi:predicted phosphate transport protein (TIGR00153 family)
VRFSFKPTDDTFFDLFAVSARNLMAGANLLAEMLQDETDMHDLSKPLREAAHEGDETTHSIVRRVNTTFVTPVDREDIYRLAAGLDDVMDFMEEAVDLVNLYEVEDLPKELANQIEVIQRCAELTAEAMPKLRTLKNLEEYWIEINRLENDGDKSYRRILAKLFNGKRDALTVMKLKDVVDALEAAIDGYETVANIIEQIAVKES